MRILDQRRSYTAGRVAAIRDALASADAICASTACVYMTGSFGRGEAGQFSDLDVFIAGRGHSRKRALSALDEILIKADLIQAARSLKIPDFSGDGEYVRHYTVGELVGELGSPKDDALNTFTARCLLLLESQPLLGAHTYQAVIDDVIAAYWRDYADHKADFVPAFLANDIIRMWRTFCVNYEARSVRKPEAKKARGKLKNYKLKYSRLLTCYSALIFLLARFSVAGAVSPDDARHMISMTPTGRLEHLANDPAMRSAHAKIDLLLESYDQFLLRSGCAEEELLAQFADTKTSRAYWSDANRFGDLVFEVLEAVGRVCDSNRFYRLLVV